MEGFVLSAVILAAVLMPGFTVYFRYARRIATSDVQSGPNFFTTPAAIIASLVGAAVIHPIWGFACAGLGHPLDYRAIEALLLGDSLGGEWFGSHWPHDYRYLAWACVYLLSQVGFAWVLGEMLGVLAQSSGWQRRTSLASAGARWHTLFRETKQSRQSDFVTVTVALDDAVDCRLFRGILDSYELTSDGGLQQVVLLGTYTRSRGNPEDQWRKIPGEYFVVNCSTARTIDINYVRLSRTVEGSGDQRAGAVGDAPIGAGS